MNSDSIVSAASDAASIVGSQASVAFDAASSHASVALNVASSQASVASEVATSAGSVAASYASIASENAVSAATSAGSVAASYASAASENAISAASLASDAATSLGSTAAVYASAASQHAVSAASILSKQASINAEKAAQFLGPYAGKAADQVNDLTQQVLNDPRVVQAVDTVYNHEYTQKVIEYFEKSSNFELLRDFIIVIIVLKQISKVRLFIRRYGLFGSIFVIYKSLATYFFTKFQQIPFVKSKVDKEVNQALQKIENQLIDRSPAITYYSTIPSTGWSIDEVTSELEKSTKMKHTKWEDGRVSGAVYHGGDKILQLQTKAYSLFSVANQLHPDVFPAVRKMESEVVSMVLNLYNAPKGAEGTSTSGGTESLLLACLSACQKAYHERGVTKPEIIAPETIHAGFDKAAYYFKINLIHAPLDPKTFKVDLKAVERLVTKNTVLIAGSAPNFPHGIIDDIEGLSKIALKNKIPLHVDACLGSFIVPFLSKAGFPDIPKFDFRVPGVTSISCDTHKYGFAPKGSSIIMYRNNQLRQYQYFVTTSWTGGLYASPTLAGSRPGALMAGCWATLMTIGYDGYLESCRDIVNTSQKIKHAIRGDAQDVYVGSGSSSEKIPEGIPELQVIGDPIASVVSFTSDKISIYELADVMNRKGWHLNALQKPAAIHIAVTRLTVPVVDEFLNDLKEAVKELVEAGSAPSSSTSDTSVLYGVAGSVKTVGVADRLAAGFLDCLYKV